MAIYKIIKPIEELYNNTDGNDDILSDIGGTDEIRMGFTNIPDNTLNEFGGDSLYSHDDNIGDDGFPPYNNNDTSPSIQNDLNANSAMYNEDLEYNHVSDATKDKYIIGEEFLGTDVRFEDEFEIFRNPKSIKNLKKNIKGIIDMKTGDFYVADYNMMLHIDFARWLNTKLGLNIPLQWNDLYSATTYLAVQRRGDSNVFGLSEVYTYDTYVMDDYKIERIISAFEKANQKNPTIEFSLEGIEANAEPELADALDERVKSSMAGSSSVEVKDKCRLGGGSTCNQGDISNLTIKPLKESISLDQPIGNDGWKSYKIMNDGQPVGEIELTTYHNYKNYIQLGKIFINKDQRHQGYAQDAMELLINYADTNKKILVLTPDNIWGASKDKLKKWYKSFGFVMNSGKYSDFTTRESMYRLPKGVKFGQQLDEGFYDNKYVAVVTPDMQLVKGTTHNAIFKQLFPDIEGYSEKYDHAFDNGYVRVIWNENEYLGQPIIHASFEGNKANLIAAIKRFYYKQIITNRSSVNVDIVETAKSFGFILPEQKQEFIAFMSGLTEDVEPITINEYPQQMEKVYGKTGLYDKEDMDAILSVTGGDPYTKWIADIFYYLANRYNKKMVEPTKLTERDRKILVDAHEMIKRYDKNILPIHDLYAQEHNAHALEKMNDLRTRELIIERLRQLPSVLLRNLRADIRKEREHYELDALFQTVKEIQNLLTLLERVKPENREKIYKKIFSSANDTFEGIKKRLDDTTLPYLSQDLEPDEIIDKVHDMGDEAEILYNENNILVVKIMSGEAMGYIGCSSQWCFASNPEHYWDNYTNQGFATIVFNFNEPESEPNRMVVVLENGEVYNMYNENIEDGYEYLNDIGVNHVINQDVKDYAEVDEYFSKFPRMSEIKEGVGDKYAEKRFNMQPEFGDFEDKYADHLGKQAQDEVVYDDTDMGGTLKIIKNPKSLSNVGPNVRGVIDKEGNFYTEQKVSGKVHTAILGVLEELELIPDEQWNWTTELPRDFITVIRLYGSNDIYLGESNEMMTPPEERDPQYYGNGYWEDFPPYEEAEPVFQEFMDAAKAKNPRINFINKNIVYTEYIKEYDNSDNGVDGLENSSTFAAEIPVTNSSELMKENELISLNDLPFKQEIEGMGGKIFSVGGAVRDKFLGKDSKDLDVLITGVPMDTLEQILNKYGKVDSVGKSFGVIKFMPNGMNLDEPIDIAIPRTEKMTAGGGHKDFDVTSDHALPIEKDLERRDFTINAIAKDSEGNLIDPYNGQEDLKNKIIRAVNPQAFSDDPLRMLRAVQFASRFGFTIEPNTMKMIQDTADRISGIAAERLLIEFDKIIKKGNIRVGVQLLKDTGLFKHIFGFDIQQSTIDRSPFEEVKTMGEFLYLLIRLLPNPAEFYLGKFATEDAKRDKIYKEIKALDIGLSNQNDNPIALRSIAHNMYAIAPESLSSQILPEALEIAAQELLSGKYPKTVGELAVNGNDLLAAGLKGKEIGDAQRKMLLKIYADKVGNNKEQLMALLGNNDLDEINLKKNAEFGDFEQQYAAHKQTAFEKPAGYVADHKGTFVPIYKNPKSLANFGSEVRAIGSLNGDLYVALNDGTFTHGKMSVALGLFNDDHDIYHSIDSFITLHRVGTTNKFKIAPSTFSSVEDDGMYLIDMFFAQLKEKNPTFEFSADIYSVDEGVGDKYAEKKFGIPDAGAEFDTKFRQAQAVSGEKPVAYVNGFNTKINAKEQSPIFLNPKSLNGFDNAVRALSNESGDLYVAQKNYGFTHGDMSVALGFFRSNYQIFESYNRFATYHRVDAMPAFGISATNEQYLKKGNEETVESMLNAARQKNPQFDFTTDYFEYVGSKYKADTNTDDDYEYLDVDEGVGDKYAEKRFGIPDTDAQYDVRYNRRQQASELEQPIAILRSNNSDVPIYKNPKSLSSFEDGVRAIADNQGNIYVALEDGYFPHGDMARALGFFPNSFGIYSKLNDYVLLHRVNDSNVFGLSDSSINQQMVNPERLSELLQMTEKRNPQYEFHDDYYENITGNREVAENLDETIRGGKYIMYHGSNHAFNKFTDEFVGSESANDQEGAGIYFTTSEEEAHRYGKYIYKVELRPRKLTNIANKRVVSVTDMSKLIRMSPTWKDDVLNWDENVMRGLATAIKSIMEYSDNEKDLFQQIEHDFFRYQPRLYVQGMTKLGFDGQLIDKDYESIVHIIVYNPEIITILESNVENIESINEEKMSNVAYSAVVLTDESHQKLVKVLKPMIPDGWEVLAHHMTINLGAIDRTQHELGEQVSLTVTDVAIDDKVLAVGVQGYPTNNKKAHITVAVNRANGDKPYMSNNLTDWKPIGFRLKLTGIITEIGK